MTQQLPRILFPGRDLGLVPASGSDASGRQNLTQLIQLRWIALFGQVVTIVFAQSAFGLDLRLTPMGLILISLAALNVLSTFRARALALAQVEVRNAELLANLLFDVAALTALLYCSGGVTNPFIFLYPLQVTLGAVLLEGWAQWAVVAITIVCFAGLTRWYIPLATPAGGAAELTDLYDVGLFICFVLDATLLAVFVSRINRNFRNRDARLAALRQRAAEEDLIVRMGLLASGAAHALGTPMATMAVILGDWQRMPLFRTHPELLQEIGDMETEVQRCKTIIGGILRSAGEPRGEAPTVTTTRHFIEDAVKEWRSSRPVDAFAYVDRLADDRSMVADAVLKQAIYNVLDNALEASPHWVGLEASQDDEALTLSVRDRGPGFAPEIIEQLGKPYNTSKGREGGGLGLFLVYNVVRKLGGTITAENREGGGAEVKVRLPLGVLSVEDHELA